MGFNRFLYWYSFKYSVVLCSIGVCFKYVQSIYLIFKFVVTTLSAHRQSQLHFSLTMWAERLWNIIMNFGRFGKIASVSLIGAMLLAGCSGNGQTVMKIGDTNITEGAVNFFANYGMGTEDVDTAVDNLKQEYLLKEVAKAMDITLTDDEAKQVKSTISNFKAQQGGKKAGDKLLKKYGVDDDIMETIISASTYSQKIMDQLDVAEPTDDEVKQYFVDNYLRAKHILISTKDMTTGADLDEDKLAEAEKKANEILERAKNGEDFDALIKEYNEDPGMESNQDGYFFTDGEMVSEFEDATKSIEPGEITMCKSDYGYHIIKRLPIDESDSKFGEYLENNKSAVQSAVTSKKQEEALEKKAEELGIKVEVNQDKIDKMVIQPKDTPEPTAEAK